MLPEVIVGNTDASITRNPAVRWTFKRDIDNGGRWVRAHHAGAGRMINGIGAGTEIREQRFIAFHTSAGNELFGNDIRQRTGLYKLTQQSVPCQNVVDIILRRQIIGMDDWIGLRDRNSRARGAPCSSGGRDYARAERPKTDPG